MLIFIWFLDIILMIAYQILTEVREWLLATGNYGISCWIKKLAKSSLSRAQGFRIILCEN